MKNTVGKFLGEDDGLFRSKTFSFTGRSTVVRAYPQGPNGLTMDALIAAAKAAAGELEEAGLMNPQDTQVESNRNGVYLTWLIASDAETYGMIAPKLTALGYKESRG